MAISTANYDPPSTAAALAEKFISGQQQVLTNRTTRASATEKGLMELRMAISGFQTALTGLTGLNKTMFAQSAGFSDTTVGTATASASAAAGTYAFYVQQLATASQVSYSLAENTGVSGPMVVKVGSASININTTTANTDGGALSPREIAAAINASSENSSLVTASVITTATGQYELVLTAKNTGTSGEVSIQYGADPANPAAPFDNKKILVPAQNAVIRIGSASGTPITQSTNTFSVIDGVTMTFTKTSASPVTLTVGADSSKTSANVQAFIDAYNKLKSTVDGLAASGDPSKGIAAGAFAGDSGVGALRSQLVNLIRPAGADSLAAYGIIANRQGTLSLDSARLTKALTADPTGLDTLIGSTAGTTPSGLAGKLDTYLKSWTSSTKGQIQNRQDAVSKLQVELSTRQEMLDKQYDAAYQRYLIQFTQLQALQSQMSNNSSMFDALFSNDKD